MKILFLAASLSATMILPFASSVQARVLEYHPNAALRLGHSVQAANPFDDKAGKACFKWKGAEPGEFTLPDSDSGDVRFDIVEVQSRSELLQKLNLSASLSARFTFAKVNSDLNFGSSMSFDEKTITYVFTGSRRFTKEQQAGEVRLNLHGRWLLHRARRQGNPRLFFDACGTEIVTARTRGTTIGVIYHFQASTSEQAQRLRATLDAKFKSGSVNFSLEKEIKSIDQRARVQVSAFQTGAPTAQPAILELIELEPGNIPRLREILAKSMDEITRESSPVLSVRTLAVESLPKVHETFNMASFQDYGLIDDELIQLQERYLLTRHRASILQDLLDRYNSDQFIAGSNIQIQEDLNSLGQVSDKIVEHARRCLVAEKFEECHSPIAALPVFTPSSYLNGYTEVHGWVYQVQEVSQWWNRYHWSAAGRYFPVVQFRNLEVIDRVVLQRNGNAIATLRYSDLLTVNERGGKLDAQYLVPVSVHEEWCWEGNPYEVCRSEISARLRGKASQQESGQKYKALIYTVDGRTLTVRLPNLDGG